MMIEMYSCPGSKNFTYIAFYPEFCLRELSMLAMIDLKLDELETRNKLAVIWLLGTFIK